MERFCSKCGTLVSGEGTFCPQCGAPMESAFDVGANVNLSKPSNTMPTAGAPAQSIPTPAPTYQQTSYQQPASGYSQYSGAPAVNSQPMSVGQWAGTIILSGLGIIGLILLFVWSFGSDTPIEKKNYARATLILQAIAYGVLIFACIIMVALGIGLSEY